MDKLTFFQKHYIIGGTFFLSFFLLAQILNIKYNAAIAKIDLQIAGIKLQSEIRPLMEAIPQHEDLAKTLLRGQTSIRRHLIEKQETINQAMQTLIFANENLEKVLETSEESFANRSLLQMSPKQLRQSWQALLKKMPGLTSKEVTKLHNELMQNTRALLYYIVERSNLPIQADLYSEYYMNKVLLDLPGQQQLLQNLNQEVESGNTKAILLTKAWLKHSLKDTERLLAQSLEFEDPSVITSVKENFSQFLLIKYIDAMKELLDKFGPTTKDLPNYEEIHKEIMDAEEDSHLFWIETLSHMNQILKIQKQRIITKKFSILGFSIFFMVVYFLVTLFMIHEGLLGIDGLLKGTSRLAEGDLTARVPIYYHDEVGMVSLSFNAMAENLERTVLQLRQLIAATKQLSSGDFTCRVPVSQDKKDEIDEVGIAFNSMANSFEDIILKLRELGNSLSSSAEDIASASKEQEAVILQQETTTRQISVTASEISTTAKEFADTVSQARVVAEETETLASSGKESLASMEQIMRHMVEASSSLATRLAILNEKAGSITGVITTITKVAEQTNLLSLNASIESEKAGEFGSSFLQIAQEIRHLADQTAISTLDIEKIVSEIMQAVSASVLGVDDFAKEIRHGVEQVQTVGGQLTKIIEQVEILTFRFESIDEGMQAQSRGARQINEAIMQLSEVAQNTTESIHQFGHTIEQLNSQSLILKQAAAKIKT